MPEGVLFSDNTSTISGVMVSGNASYSTNDYIQFVVDKKKEAIAPQLYFKYVKSKFGVLERFKIDARIKRMEKAFLAAVDNGQEALGQKLLSELAREARETLIYAKGIKHFIEKDVLHKHKNSVKGGHISDTQLKDFTRAIPAEVLKKKKEVEKVFDGFVIYHYWNENAEKVRAGKQKMSAEEKRSMRDPILFGTIRESNRLYFIADWEDEYCDLTFDDLMDVIGSEAEKTLTNKPTI